MLWFTLPAIGGGMVQKDPAVVGRALIRGITAIDLPIIFAKSGGGQADKEPESKIKMKNHTHQEKGTWKKETLGAKPSRCNMHEVFRRFGGGKPWTKKKKRSEDPGNNDARTLRA